MGLGLVSMTCTSEDRIEMAAKLRQIADEHDAIHAFSNADIRYIADLIDPTCCVDSVDSTAGLPAYNLSCGDTVFVHPGELMPSYCPHCGARVVDDDK